MNNTFTNYEPKICPVCSLTVRVGLDNFIGWQSDGNGKLMALYNCKCNNTLCSKEITNMEDQ